MTRVCILSFDDPWKASHGGTLRTRLFVDAVLQSGAETHVVYPGADPVDPAPQEARLHAVETGRGGVGSQGRAARAKRHLLPMPLLRAGLIPDMQALVDELEPDLLIVSQLRGAQYSDSMRPRNLWLDQSDVWSRFLLPEIARRTGFAKRTADLQRRHLKAVEERYANRAAVVTAAGLEDAEDLIARTQTQVRWLPTAVRTGRSDRRQDVPTAGLFANFAYWPNRDAYEILVRDWLPVLRRCGWRTLVAGLESETLPPAPGCVLGGTVAEVKDFYDQIDVALAPIRLGGGIKVKVVESLMWRVPVLASPQALEGLPPTLRRVLPVVDTPGSLEMRLNSMFDFESAFDKAASWFSIEAWNRTVSNALAETR